MPREFPMPSRDERGPTEFAGRDPQFARRTLVLTDENEEVIIVRYIKNMGLYTVLRRDGGPLFRIDPGRLHLRDE